MYLPYDNRIAFFIVITLGITTYFGVIIYGIVNHNNYLKERFNNSQIERKVDKLQEDINLQKDYVTDSSVSYKELTQDVLSLSSTIKDLYPIDANDQKSRFSRIFLNNLQFIKYNLEISGAPRDALSELLTLDYLYYKRYVLEVE